MPIDTVEYVLIDGKRYAVARDQFRRFSLPLEIPQLKAKRSQSPFIDAELTAFDGGYKADDLNDEGTWYRSSLGMEPAGPTGAAALRWLKVGKQLPILGALQGLGTFIRHLLPFEGFLFATISGVGVDSWNGSAWTAELSNVNVSVLASAFGSLHVFNTNNEDRQDSTDGVGIWNARDMTGFTSTGVYGAMAVPLGTGERLYAVLDEAAAVGNPAKVAYIGALADLTWVEAFTLRERFSRGAITVIGTDLYVAGVETATNAKSATIYKLTNNTTPAAVQASITGAYFVSATALGGKTYWATDSGGDVYELDGTTLRKIADFDAAGNVQLYMREGVLWAAYENSAGTRLILEQWNGSAWHSPHYMAVTDITQVNALSAYNARLVIGLTAGATTNVREVSASSRQTAAELEMPDVVYGAPGLRKIYYSCSLQHSKLLSGQSVQLRYKLDDGSEVTVASNSNVNDTETTISLAKEVAGARLRPKWYITNGASQDLTVYGARVRALPDPGERQVWGASLRLLQRPGNQWADAVADSLNELQKFATLQALRKSGRYFQAVGPFRDGTDVKEAMQAVFDPQVPLDWRMVELAGTSIEIVVPVRLLQALGPVTGLLNGSFEQDADGAAPSNWTVTGTGTSSNVSTAAAAVGTKSLNVVFDGVSASYGRQQTVSGLVAERYYTVGGYIRRTTTAGTVRIKVTAGASTFGTPSLANATDADFVWYETVFQLPAGSTSITIALIGEGTPAGSCRFDGIKVEE